MRRALALALVALTWPIAVVAVADAVGSAAGLTPAPTDCPRGAQAIPGTHGRRAHCRPSECESAAGCMGSMAPCEELGLCLVTGMTRGATFMTAPRACETDADCEGLLSHGGPDAETRCEVRLRCGGLPGPRPEGAESEEPDEAPEEEAEEPEVEPEPAEAPATEAENAAGCGCRATRSRGGPLALVALLFFLTVRRSA